MISIIYSTNRKEPQFKWFIDSLLNQTSKEDRESIELIFIDYAYGKIGEPRRVELETLIGNDFKFIHADPKDNDYQGEFRRTNTEYFSPCNARNTGFMYSSGDYIVFVDDVGVLMPTWFDAVKEAANKKLVMCGAYQKHFEMVVEYGKLISSRKGGIDSRWKLSEDKPVRIDGGQLFGCSFGLTSEAFEQVNGFDELCDSIGGEDYHLGIRLENSGYKIWYDRRMLTIESEELHNQDYKMLREDRVLSEESYMKLLAEYGVYSRIRPKGNLDSSHIILDILYGLRQRTTLGNNYNIKMQRQNKTLPSQRGDELHWFDNKILSEL